jgi:hypothetical protein
MTRVERLWPDSTIVCIGSGPSLTPEDVNACGEARSIGPRGIDARPGERWHRVCVIAINNAWQLAPWAQVLYACDAKWYGWNSGVPTFRGLKYSIDPQSAKWPGVQVLQNTGPLGLELEPTGLRTGKNSGFQAINLAVHLGASRILLLGYDMSPAPDGRDHWHGSHPDGQIPPFAAMLATFPSLVAPLAALNIQVVNCSRRTALDVFPKARLEDELARLERAA